MDDNLLETFGDALRGLRAKNVAIAFIGSDDQPHALLDGPLTVPAVTQLLMEIINEMGENIRAKQGDEIASALRLAVAQTLVKIFDKKN